MKNLEESRPDFTKNCVNDTKLFEVLVSETPMKRVQEMRIDDISIQKLRESHATIQERPHFTTTAVTGKNGSQE